MKSAILLLSILALWMPPAHSGEGNDLPPPPPLPPMKDDTTAAKNGKADPQLPQAEIDHVVALFLRVQEGCKDFVLGKKRDMTREELIACVKDEPDVFNFLVEFTYKNQGRPFPVQHFLFEDIGRKSVLQTSRGTVRENISITAGFTTDHRPIWIATRNYDPSPDDKNNLGGQLMLIVLAKETK